MNSSCHYRLLCALVLVMALAGAAPALAEKGPKAVYGDGPNVFSLATGSPGELGLLEALAAAFNPKHDATLHWYKAGSGKSLKLLKAKDVDMVMVHAPAAEKQAVADGWARMRTLIGSNEFYVVGPAGDPGGIKDATTVAEAYASIAANKATFFSRGDNSGTHKKELAIWKKAGVAPAGAWYVETKDFMAATLKRANAEGGYFMTDSSTWVAYKKETPNLTVLFRGDPFLINTYHALGQPAGATKGADLAAAFIEFVASPEGQAIIANYGKDTYGEGMYNDAAYAKQFDK